MHVRVTMYANRPTVPRSFVSTQHKALIQNLIHLHGTLIESYKGSHILLLLFAPHLRVDLVLFYLSDMKQYTKQHKCIEWNKPAGCIPHQTSKIRYSFLNSP